MKNNLARVVFSLLCASLFFLSGKNALSADKDKVSALLAETYLASGQNEKAIAAYSLIVKDKPDDIKARMSLAKLLSWEKRYGEAVTEYREILKIDPSNREAMKDLAEVYVWRGDIDSAKEEYKKLVSSGDKNEDVLLRFAEILIWKGEYDEALRFIEESGSAKEPRAGMLKAKAFLYSGKFALAEEVLKSILAGDKDNIEAKALLADTYAYSRRFAEAEKLYGEILKDKPNDEVKIKLADVLSWDKQYEKALKLYDETLSAKYDEKVHRQKARVMGWDRRYSEAEKEYESLAAKSESSAARIEGGAKKAYWSGRVKKAIKLYSELIKLEPENTEAMFDLSQIYAYQSMWDDALSEYEGILEKNPAHFRAKEGKEKALLISKHPLSSARYRYFEGDSAGRDMDMRIHELLSGVRFPLSGRFFMDVEYALRGRQYRDFRDTTENEGRFKLTWLNGPDWRASGYYGVMGYAGGIDEFTHLFGGSFSRRIFDLGEFLFTYDREKLENNSEVIRRNFTRNRFRNSVYFDITNRLRAGADYTVAAYSDGNVLNEPSVDVLYRLSFEPRLLTAGYRYSYREFKNKVGEYFSPKGFSSNTFLVNWRHYLNKEERFFGANDIYYDVKYELIVDSQYIAGNKFSWEAGWDITKRFNLNVRGGFMGSSAGVYEESEFVAGIKYYF